LSGGPRPAEDVFKDGSKDGHTGATLKRVKVTMGVRSHKEAMSTPWVWSLPLITDFDEADAAT
jgi:hypothetical protein